MVEELAGTRENEHREAERSCGVVDTFEEGRCDVGDPFSRRCCDEGDDGVWVDGWGKVLDEESEPCRTGVEGAEQRVQAGVKCLPEGGSASGAFWVRHISAVAEISAA